MSHVTFREYLTLQAQVEAAEQLDEALGFQTKKLVDGIKAAIRMRAERRAAELMAKLSAEAAKRRELRNLKQGAAEAGNKLETLPKDVEDALSPDDKKFLVKATKKFSSGAQGTQGTQGTR